MMLGRNATLTMKKTQIPEYLPISPLAQPCPSWHAKPNQIRQTISGGRFELVHARESKLLPKSDEAEKNRKK